MPLKVVSRKGSPFLYVRGTVKGQEVFESTETADPHQAEGYRIKRERELWEGRTHGARAIADFADAATSYLQFETRSDATKAYVKKLVDHFGCKPLGEIDQGAADLACRKMLSPAAKASTRIRAVYTPLRAILKHAAIRKMCDMPTFELPGVQKTKKLFMLPDEVNRLIAGAAPHLRPLLTFLVGTGVRMSEALELEWSDVDLRGARAVVRQKQGNYRHLDLCPRVLAALTAMPSRTGNVFMTPQVVDKKGRIVRKAAPYERTRVSGGQIKKAWATACRNAELPGTMREWKAKRTDKVMKAFIPDFTPHSLRHTWASWHYCAHKDLMLLMAEGGWSTINMVTHYAKLMPDVYRQEVLDWRAGGPASLLRKTA